jgi:small Trp-rich protein
MVFLIVGLLLVVLKFAEVSPVAGWSWLWIFIPFGLAVAWWAFADQSGLTQRRAMKQMEEKKRQRRDRDMKALGLDVRRDKRIRVLRDPREKAAPPAEGDAGGDKRPP